MSSQRIIIICEGPTEQEFCNKLLAKFLSSFQLSCPIIKRSGGGIVPWKHLKKQVENHLEQDRSAYVTTFIDYYGIGDRHQFPSWQEAKQLSDKYHRIEFLEQKMREDIDEAYRYRFIPNLQLHEFETLLFADPQAFESQLTEQEYDREMLLSIVGEFPNPENINNSPKTSPSHRLEEIIQGYNKVVYGNCLAEAVTIRRMLGKCSHFAGWLNTIKNLPSL